VNAGTKAAETCPEILRKIIEEAGYTAQQIYYVDEAGLFKKCQTVRTANVSGSRPKAMAFERKHPRRSKILIKNKIIGQVSHFNYLGCDVSCNYDVDFQTKLNKFQYLCGTIKRTLANKTRKIHNLNFMKLWLQKCFCMDVKFGQ
jgi:hypothetical protein